MAKAAARKNSDKKSGPRRGPTRDARGRLSGGNPGNSGGKKGRSGRKPLAFKLFCGEVLESTETQEELRAAVKDRTTAGYGTLIKTLAAYHVGLPAQPHTGEGGTGPIAHSVAVTVTRRIVRPGEAA